MIKAIKRGVLSCFLSIICGSICGIIIYNIYDDALDLDINGDKIYLIQAGAYSSYDNMVKNTSLNNYIYYEDSDGYFKSIIGITENVDNIEKIKSTYNDDVIINEYYSSDIELNKKIKEYDLKLKEISDKDKIKEIVLEVLSLYKDKESTLTQIKS